MTIDKAIETLSFELLPLRGFLHKDYNQAIELGIEALKRIKRIRTAGIDELNTVSFVRLPGETER